MRMGVIAVFKTTTLTHIFTAILQSLRAAYRIILGVLRHLSLRPVLMTWPLHLGMPMLPAIPATYTSQSSRKDGTVALV